VTDDFRAGSVYSASLEPIHGGKAWTLAWVKGLMLATAALIGFWDRPAIGDLVVRRRADGSEALRTGAGDQDEAAHLLAHVQGQLEELPAVEFEAAWGLEADLGLGSVGG
jgi:hypothetical protein